MKTFETHLEQTVINRFQEALNSQALTIKIQDTWDTPILIRRYDMVIYRDLFPLAVVEIKANIDKKDILARTTDRVRSAMSITNSRFGIVTDNELFYILDKSDIKRDFVKSSFDKIIQQLSNPSNIKIYKKDLKGVYDIIIKSANSYLNDNILFLDFLNEKHIESRIEFNSETNTFCFSGEGSGRASFENQFFNTMLGEFNDQYICHYTPLKTIYEILNNISFRMSGIVGMNDKSEVNYVENYFNQGNNESDVGKPLNKEHYNTIIALNKRFITSCSTIDRLDDLTLWRLYADDAKGVCLVFEINKLKLNNHVLLQNVKYANNDGKHKYLDFLKQIKDEVLNLTGFNFEFKKLNYWKHFFKPYEYTIESEVRLLVVDNDSLPKLKTEWVMTYMHSIFNPIIDFRLNTNNFPIHLKKIIIGPKSPEQVTNQVQIEEMIRRKKKIIAEEGIPSKIIDLKVELSKITNYR